MKKRTLKTVLIALLSVFLSFTACKKEDAPSAKTDKIVKSGETFTIKASDNYVLEKSIIVEDGGKLVVEKGSKIECVGGTNAYVTIKQGGKIDIQGTKDAPVVFTNSSKKPASWGGIVLAGKARVNIPNKQGILEVGGDFIYGGNIDNDNSGSIKYCRIEYSGAKFSPEKEYNGLSLFGVGSETVLENISIIKGTDDGIEFFGGTANVKNLILLENEDDQLDWTEGWSGSATNVYAKRGDDGVGNRGIEADSNKNENKAEPISNPTITNVTLIGSKSGDESQAVKLRVGTRGKLTNLVLSNWSTGFDISSEQTATWFAGGENISQVKFDKVETPIKVKDGSNFLITSDDTATGAENGTEFPSWATGWAELSK